VRDAELALAGVDEVLARHAQIAREWQQTTRRTHA
jgi:hypothetical protein